MNNNYVILCTGGSWECVNRENVYVREGFKNSGLLIPPNVDHLLLIQMVKNKTGLLNSQISVSFQHPEFGYVVDIEDDSDVMKLKQVMYEETKQPVHLYVSVIGVFPEEQVVVKKPCQWKRKQEPL